MVWGEKLKSLFPDSNLRGRIRMKLLLQPDGIREAIFDEDDDAVKSSLLTLLEPADSGDSAKLPAAGQAFPLFVQSARRNYLEWERSRKEFLEVKEDPFANYSGPFLIWVRKCYVDLKNMLVEEEAKELGQRFILLGTAGIGKSFFTIFWVCYLATKKKRIVWKLDNGSCYLLDFSQDAVTEQGPVDTLNHPVLVQVVNDVDSWLIIDGGLKTGLQYKCNILLACSAKKENHHEFGKGGRVKFWYLPVWSEDEIKGFCDAFVEHKSEFSAMDVPGKDTALANFKELGGVPRYVLHAGKMVQGRAVLRHALDSVSAVNCLQVYAGLFNPELGDMLIHMFVDEKEYTGFKYDFASSDVRHSIEQHLRRVGKVYVVNFLEQSIRSSTLGTMWGHMYELVAPAILSRGGNFKRKRVSETGAEVHDTFQQKELKFVTFSTLQELTKLKDDYPSGAYCQPSSLNCESADAVIVPDTLVQYFKYRKGNHGYKIHGLKELDNALNLKNYSLWSCVPPESYEETKYQNWVTTKGTKYKCMTSEEQGLVEKLHQYVVEVDYRKYIE
ncbi:hypothetical protein KC19_5G145100 [Ceratodon purpureus]|uniref:Uncharacterized protein n=1 Tax=Ceratodon purpureus TaxID=3225 RepID=A0A8T0I2V6_CERPU|nr:hypothetical protein KC19_5G145100 [Ceratodon purpureus]